VRDAPAGNASLPVARWRSITRMNRSFLSTDILRLPLRTGSEALDRSLVFSGVAIKRLMSRCVSERFERRSDVESAWERSSAIGAGDYGNAARNLFARVPLACHYTLEGRNKAEGRKREGKKERAVQQSSSRGFRLTF